MARSAQRILLVLTILAAASGAWAADSLTPGDLGWLRDNLNLAADSPAIATLSEAQKTRLHGLIEARTGLDRKRQSVVGFLTSLAGSSLEGTLDRARQPPAGGELGSLGK